MIVLSLYGLHPFINGSGCDFQSQAIGKTFDRYTTCRFGIITVIEKNKVTARNVAYQGIYGVTGRSSLVFVYDITYDDKDQETVLDDFLFQSRYFYISNKIVVDTTDWVIVKAPFYKIYPSKRVGRLSWW
ncbi:MAG: hypothetical protein ACRC4I_15615 [Aeromonas veronii]